MCRCISEGGRRCPHDTSEARRLRRRAAAKRVEYAAELVGTESSKLPDPTPEPSVTLTSVKELVSSLEEDKEAFNELSAFGGKVWGGVEYASKWEARDAARSAMEQKTLLIGHQVVQLADQISGYDDTALAEVIAEANNSAAAKELLDVTERQKSILDRAHQMMGVDPEKASSYFPYHYLTAVEDPENKQVMSDLKEEYMSLSQRMNELSTKVRQQLDGTSPEVQEILQARVSAYREVLGQIRPMGGEATNLHAKSDKKKSAVLQEALQNVPTAWIEASNNTKPFIVKKTTARAHYSTSKRQSTSVLSQGVSLRLTDENSETYKRAVEEGYTIIRQGEKWTDEKTNHTYEAGYIGEHEALVLEPQWDYPSHWAGKKEDGSPAQGRGWKPYTFKGQVYDSATQQHVYVEETRWRRPRMKKHEVEAEYIPELSVDSSSHLTDREDRRGVSTALHEFSHRVESMNPHINLMESTFVERRTTDANGERHKLKVYHGKEVTRPDEFADTYMGKQYNDNRFFEVLSTGSEAVFYGEYGALEGLGKRNSDHEMRNFILGLYASA